MRNMRIAELLFNRPLLISEAKLNVILHVLGPRFNLDLSGMPQAGMAPISDQERSRAGYRAAGGVGLIGVHGPLMHRVLASEYPSGGPTTYADIRRAFDVAMVDDAVQAVVLDLDSPGGEVNGCFDLADHIYASRGTKPITAVVNEQACSGAYLLASAADRIIIPRTGAAGSIGVIATHADFSRAEDAAGITVTHIFAGARKADFSPHAPLSSEALQTLQEMIGDTYDLFVETVARNRRLSVKKVRETEAAIYEGKKAVAAGLADEVAPADRAISGAARPKGKTMIAAVGNVPAALTTTNKENSMDARTLRQEHPEAVAEIEAAAREGMIANQVAAEAQAAAVTAAVTAEQGRITGLVTATMGDETGKRFAAVVAAGLTADQATELGISCAPAGQDGDEASRAAILAGIKGAAPAGLKGAQPAGGSTEERQSAVSAIAAGGSAKR